MSKFRTIVYGLVAFIGLLATSIVPVEESALLDGKVECEVVIGQPAKEQVYKVACKSRVRHIFPKQHPAAPIVLTEIPLQKSPIFILHRSLLI